MQRRNTCPETLTKLAKVLKLVGDTEISIELNRQSLAKLKQFEPYASFQRIDRASKGYITPKDFLNFLK